MKTNNNNNVRNGDDDGKYCSTKKRQQQQQQQQQRPPTITAGRNNHGSSSNTTTRRISAARFILYCVGVMVVSIPFLISFAFFATFDQSMVTTIADCGPNCGNGDAFTSMLAGSRVSSSSSSSKYSHSHPPCKYSMDNPPGNSNDDDSPYTILHTVTTRFMVGQAPPTSTTPTSTTTTQYHLARARYLLFETFCWPTMKFQTSMNFYWIVLVDPGLDRGILGDLQNLLSSGSNNGNGGHFPTGNAFMVLTNNTAWSQDGVGVENATSYGVGLQTIAEEFKHNHLKIATGNTQHLLRALDWMEQGSSNSKNDKNNKIKKPIMVIETLLDADDGLNNHGVEWIQNIALERTKEQQQQQQQHQQQTTTTAADNTIHYSSTIPDSSPSPSLNSTWWFLCGTDHIEWHNRDIFKLTNEEYSEKGVTSGLTGLRQSPYFCTSAGFTRIGITAGAVVAATASQSSSLPSTSPSSPMKFPKDAYSNHALTFYFPECTTTTATATATAIDISRSGNYSHCWRREFPREAFILKSRTITSDSMDHLNPKKTDDYRDVAWLNKTDFPLLINETEKMWHTLWTDFSIDRLKAWETSVYLFENRKLILRENKESRCSPGFPCYQEAKKNLIRMERYWNDQTKTKTKKKYRVVRTRNSTVAIAALKGDVKKIPSK